MIDREFLSFFMILTYIATTTAFTMLRPLTCIHHVHRLHFVQLITHTNRSISNNNNNLDIIIKWIHIYMHHHQLIPLHKLSCLSLFLSLSLWIPKPHSQCKIYSFKIGMVSNMKSLPLLVKNMHHQYSVPLNSLPIQRLNPASFLSGPLSLSHYSGSDWQGPSLMRAAERGDYSEKNDLPYDVSHRVVTIIYLPTILW